MLTFKQSPFLLQIGDLIQGKVSCSNQAGTSLYSTPNTAGTTVQDNPTGKVVLSRGVNTKFNSIELLWTQLLTSPENGNSVITGYKVYWDDTGYY